MYTAKLKLLMTADDKYMAGRRYYAVNKLHNILISHAKSLIHGMSSDSRYQSARDEYCSLLKHDHLSDAQKTRKKELSNFMSDYRAGISLTENDFEKYSKQWRQRYTNLVSSQQMQAEASNVWKSVDSFLFKNGKEIHYRKISDMKTITGKSNTNGVRFDVNTFHIDWLGLDIPCKADTKDPYVREALSLDNPEELDISYCQIKREPFKNGYHYYVILYIKGNAPKRKPTARDDSVMGIDPGISTEAVVTDDAVFLEELAPDAQKYDKAIANTQKRMDISKRATNPDNFNPDGTVKPKKERKPWRFSKHYKDLRWQLRDTYRRKSEYVKTSHGALANRLIEHSININVEKNNFSAMTKRSAKPDERKDQETEITTKDGNTKTIRKYKKKKRFGRSVNNRSPALFLSILKRKVKQYGGSCNEISPQTFKASQYCHDTDEYIKSELSERFKVINGHEVQRDLYSAFLIMNADDDYKYADRNKCIENFDCFVKLHDAAIADMKNRNISMKQCFGF